MSVVSLDNKRAYSRKTAEEALLGGAMLRPEVFLEVQAELKATDFGDPLHRGIWETLEKLTGEGKTFTSFDVLSELQKKSEVDTERFLHIASHVPAGVAGQIETVKEASRMEGLRAALGSALRWYEDEEHEGSKDLADKIQELFIGLSDKVDPGKRGLSEVGPIASQALEELKRRQETGEVAGEMSGIATLDRSIGGFKAGALYILAARPGMGKTALALNIAQNVAREKPVAFFSLEMPSIQLSQRLLSSGASLSVQNIEEGRVTPEELSRLEEAVAELQHQQLLIDDTAGATLAYIRGQLRLQQSRGRPPALIVIDYLQLMSARKGSRRSREQEISEMSRGLKELAKDFACPVICLSQLNRNAEGRPNKRPLLSDLRESGSIEQDADMVLLVYRDDYYDPESEDKGLAEVIIAKNRSGRTGTTKLVFSGETVRFHALTREEEPERWGWKPEGQGWGDLNR
jgi:replicative DNA helicase